MTSIRRAAVVLASAAIAASTFTVGLTSSPAQAATWQLSNLTTPGVDAIRLAQELAGQGVTVNSATFTGDPLSAGLFGGAGVADTIGVTDGVVLSSGEITAVAGPNDSSGESGITTGGSDPDLDALVDGSINDAAVLEVSFTPQTADLQINYVFASEEYKEYVDSSFNDVFAFFINGTNCATVAGASGPAPVSINSINHLRNQQIFVDNTGDGTPSGEPPFDTEFDGFTQVLTCFANVMPGVPNTMKLAIADVSDSILDSAVFLESAGVTSTPKTKYSPLSPTRLYDTRTTAPPAKLPAGQSITIPVAGLHGIPNDVVSVALNVTAVNAEAPGYLTAYPSGAPVPLASNVNYFGANAVPNLVIAKVGTDGKISVFSSATSDVVVDLFGYFSVAAANGFLPTVPHRVIDTRNTGKPGAGSTVTFDITSAGVPAGAPAVVLNLTITEPDTLGYAAAFAAGAAVPATSNVNYYAGETRPNAVIAPVSADGKVSVFTLASAHIVADVMGYYSTASESELFKPVNPKRVYDTRQHTAIAAGGTLELKVTDIVGVPSTATAVILNVTATEPVGVGYLTVFPANVAQPLASNVNYFPGQTVPNVVISGVSPDGRVKIYSLAQTHVVVDVAGWFG
jgi:hypothetical protein